MTSKKTPTNADCQSAHTTIDNGKMTSKYPVIYDHGDRKTFK